MPDHVPCLYGPNDGQWVTVDGDAPERISLASPAKRWLRHHYSLHVLKCGPRYVHIGYEIDCRKENA